MEHQLTPLLLHSWQFICRGGENGFSGASGECGAVHLFNAPSMTTGDKENSCVFEFFRQYCRNSIEQEEPYAAVLSFLCAIVRLEQRTAKAPLHFE